MGQYYNIHIFLSFLGSLLKQCILFKIFLQFSLSPPYTKLKLGKKILDTRVQHCMWGEGRGLTCVNWKTPQKRKSVPRLFFMIVVTDRSSYSTYRFKKVFGCCFSLAHLQVGLPFKISSGHTLEVKKVLLVDPKTPLRRYWQSP